MRNVIITGATSFIGIRLVQKLLDTGIFVYAIVRSDSKNVKKLPEHKNLEIIYTDLSQIELLKKNKFEIEIFFHLGWDGVGSTGRDNPDIQLLNIKNTLKAIDTANYLKCKCFVMAGSQAEYGYVDGLITESTSCSPITEYGKAKLQVFSHAIIRCSNLKMKYLHLRIFSIYGENDHEWTLISEIIRKLMKSEDVRLSNCTQFWNYLNVSDAADQIIMLTNLMLNCEDKKIEVYNIASTDTRILRDFTDEIARIIQSSSKLLYGEKKVQDPLSLQPDINKLIKDTNWQSQIDFVQGIKSIINSV